MDMAYFQILNFETSKRKVKKYIKKVYKKSPLEECSSCNII